MTNFGLNEQKSAFDASALAMNEEDATHDVSLQIRFDRTTVETLLDTLNCEPVLFEEEFAKFAKAAVDEYIEMLTGRASPIKFDHKFRLAMIVTHLKKIPDENFMQRIFNLTLQKSRNCINETISMYRRQIKESIDRTIVEILGACEDVPASHAKHLAVQHKSLIDVMNQVLNDGNKKYTSIIKQKGPLSTYRIEKEEYEYLCGKFVESAAAYENGDHSNAKH